MTKKQPFLGVFFIVAGITVIVAKLGVMSELPLFKLMLAVGLAYVCVKSIFRLNFWGILFSVAFI
ncbi:MAG: LiaF transmembrane domain-containing protein, partial [Bacilli bacterium]